MLGDARYIDRRTKIPKASSSTFNSRGVGRRPISRRGDGRAALGPMLREYLISEAMHALGIPTTRSLAVVATGQPVYRETVLPGAVLTRLPPVTFECTFEYLAARQDVEGSEFLPTLPSRVTIQQSLRQPALSRLLSEK